VPSYGIDGMTSAFQYARSLSVSRQSRVGCALLEDDARRQRHGLWADAAPIAPWEWRKTEKERKAARKAVGTGQ